MRIDVITLFPGMFDALTGFGITRRAVEQKLLELVLWNPRDFTHDRHRTVDDRPYGGGPGMVMLYQPLWDAIEAARGASEKEARVGYLSPQGRVLDQAAVRELAGRERLVLVCGRYEGVDERLLEAAVDEEWSIGDYVLSGGELGAMAMIDALTRLIPGALGHEDSAEQDSFSGGLLDYPHYTRPEVIQGREVPGILLSGHHQRVAQWRRKQALGRTWLRRPDLLKGVSLSEGDQALLEDYIREQKRN